MSSTVFEVVLRPDRDLQRVVRGSGIFLTAVGIIVIMQMPFAHFWRLLLGSIWLAESLREQISLRSGALRVSSLTLNSRGIIVAAGGHGDLHELKLLSGSVVLPRIAWFRLGFRDGSCYSALFTRQRTGPAAWHRLQLLWQQAHRAFGHPPGP